MINDDDHDINHDNDDDDSNDDDGFSFQETETPSSEQYETADHYDSGTDRSSALSRFSDSTAISSFAGEGETFDATDADITVVSSLAS